MKKPFKIYIPASIRGKAIFAGEIEVETRFEEGEEFLTAESLEKIKAAQEKAIKDWTNENN